MITRNGLLRRSAVVLAALLGCATAAMSTDIALSGTVYDKDNKPLSGVLVSLAQGKLSTVTDNNGGWSLVGAVSGLERRMLRSGPSNNLVLENGHLRVRLSGFDATGRGLRSQPAVVLNQGNVSARTFASQDTLLYSLGGKVRLRDTVSGALSGIVRKLDTTWNASIIYGYLKDARDGQQYRTVTIGAQTWMAENLNYAGATGTIGACFNNSPDSCAKYGRGYVWAEVMQGSISSSASPSGVQGLCPDGWHVPSDAEWITLTQVVDSNASVTATNVVSLTAGGALKSTSGWIPNKGTDLYGFHALPSSFSNYSGAYGYWWTSEVDSYLHAKGRWMMSANAELYQVGLYADKSSRAEGISLRCLKNNAPSPTDTIATPNDSRLSGLTVTGGGRLRPNFVKSNFAYRDTVENSVSSVTVTGATLDGTNTVAYSVDGGAYTTSGLTTLVAGSMTIVSVKVTNRNGNSLVYTIGVYRKSESTAVPPVTPNIPWRKWITYGSVTHGGQTYKTVVIGTQLWMAENLNYAGATGTIGKCYNNSEDSCAKYGRLYTWSEVMQGSVSSSTSPSGVQGLCPNGWHVPSDVEWSMLESYADPASRAEGLMLKSLSGWNDDTSGTDQYGFRALPGGNSYGASFYNAGYVGFWWSATENDATSAWGRYVDFSIAYMGRYYFNNKKNVFSLRCSKDLF